MADVETRVWRHGMRSIAICALLASLFVGCPTYAGRTFIDVAGPERVTVYLVSADDWRREGQERLLGDDLALRRYRKGATDIEALPIREGRYMLVTECGTGGQRRRDVRAIEVAFGDANRVQVSCPQ